MSNLETFEFTSPRKLLFGIGMVKRLGPELKLLKAGKVLVVTDKGLVKAGLLDKLTDELKQAGIGFAVFDAIQENPTMPSIHEGADRYRQENCAGIVALGGGSPMDAAKAIAVKVSHEGDIVRYVRGGDKAVEDILPPLVTVATTSGTGSEVTKFAVITHVEKKSKMVIASPYILPQVAIADPALTQSLPPAVTAATGMDALTHAIECYVSPVATRMTDTLALKAIELIGTNLRQAVANGDNLEARSNMMLASTMAGMAFGNASVGMVHAVAHALGGLFNIPHGVANALMLPPVMAFNLIACPAKFADIAVALGEVLVGLSPMEAAQCAVDAVQMLSEDVGIPQDLKALGADPAKIDALVDESETQGAIRFNPRKVTRPDLVTLFTEAFED